MLRLKSIRIRDFLSVELQEIEYSSEGLILVLGENQDTAESDSNFSGKTNMMTEPISWVFFGRGTKEVKQDGKTMASYTADSVIRSGCSSCEVSQWFAVDNVDYCVTRSRDRSGPGLSLVQNGVKEPLTKTTVPETQKFIEQLIGFTHATFTQTFFFGRNTARFATATDSERKTVLEQVLQMGAVSEALKTTKKQLETVNVAHKKMSDVLISANTQIQISEGEVESASASLSAWQESLQRYKKELEYKKSGLKVDITSRSEDLGELQRLYKTQRERFKSLNLDGIKHQIGELEISIASARVGLNTINEQVDALTVKRKRMGGLEEETCPVCQKIVSPEDSKHVCEELSIEIGVLMRKAAKIADTMVSHYTPTLSTLKEKEKTVEDIRDANKERKLAISSLENLISGYTTQLTNLQNSIDSLEGKDRSFEERLDKETNKLVLVRATTATALSLLDEIEEQV